MPGRYKAYQRNLGSSLESLIKKGQSALILGPRQTGKTTLVKEILPANRNVITYSLQDPRIRLEMEKDPSLIIRQLKARTGRSLVFIDEAQKVPEIFDSIQLMIDEKIANFIITGSSARKLKRKGVNLLPGRVKACRLDPLLWNEFGWIEKQTTGILPVDNINNLKQYTFEQSLIYGALPGIVAMDDDRERREMITAYTHIYLEEEIRAEALSRKIGAFGRFLELAAQESGTNPNLTKLSLESGVSVPTIKEFFSILEDTLVVEKVGPYLKNARKRILASPRYYFFDLGVRNAMARAPLTEGLLNVDKGRLFEHAVILEIIRRIRSLNLGYKVYYWRTAAGAEVDCVIDTGTEVIPVEIKSGGNVRLSELKGLQSFIETYRKLVKQAFVVTAGRLPEKLNDMITAVPWRYL